MSSASKKTYTACLNCRNLSMQQHVGAVCPNACNSNNAILNSSANSTFSPQKYSTPAVSSTASTWKTNGQQTLRMPEKTPLVTKEAAARVVNSVFSPLTEDDYTPPSTTDSLDEIRHNKVLSTHSSTCLNQIKSQKLTSSFYKSPTSTVTAVNSKKILVNRSNKENTSLSATSKLITDNVTIRGKIFDEQNLFPTVNKIGKDSSDRHTKTENIPCPYCSHDFVQSLSSVNHGDSPQASPITHNRQDILRPDYVRPIIEDFFEELDDRFRRNFSGFFSQVLRHFDAQSEKMDTILQKKKLIENLTHENEYLKNLVARLEALRYRK